MRYQHPPDRLFLLSTMRLALRSQRLTTPEAVLRAGGRQLSELGEHARAIIKIVRVGDPDVLRALFWPAAPIDWQVAGSAHDAYVRLLSVDRRESKYVAEVVLDYRYRVDDDGSGEREAWVKLRDALRGAQPPAAQE